MKPHEQNWTRRAGRAGVLDVSEGLTLEVRCDLSLMLQDEAETLRRVESTVALAESAPNMAQALVGLMQEDRRRGSDVAERHTARCWDGIYAYLMRDGCSAPECAAAHVALRKAGVL